ncbi:unnamed protein product [Penicillium salamii]|nr:unnamed protein product [Penicillium salamii]
MQNKLNAIQTFIRVAEAGSFSAAARQNGMKQSAVSQQIAALEEALGVVLLHRTTRKMALTEQGQHYLQQVRQLLSAMEELEQQLRPEWQPLLNIALEDRLSDLIGEGVDVAIRLSESPPATLAARSLTTVETVLVASPEWIARNDMPQTPSDLQHHLHIRFSGVSPDAPLQLVSATARVSVPVESAFRSNNSDALMQALEAGLGIGGLQKLIGADALASGRLVRVLPDWRLPDRYLYAVFPDARFIPDKVRKLVTHLSEVLVGLQGTGQKLI